MIIDNKKTKVKILKSRVKIKSHVIIKSSNDYSSDYSSDCSSSDLSLSRMKKIKKVIYR